MERVWHQKGAVPTRFLLLSFSLAMLDAHAIGQRDIADEKIERPRAAASMAERTFCVAATDEQSFQCCARVLVLAISTFLRSRRNALMDKM